MLTSASALKSLKDSCKELCRSILSSSLQGNKQAALPRLLQIDLLMRKNWCTVNIIKSFKSEYSIPIPNIAVRDFQTPRAAVHALRKYPFKPTPHLPLQSLWHNLHVAFRTIDKIDFLGRHGSKDQNTQTSNATAILFKLSRRTSTEWGCSLKLQRNTPEPSGDLAKLLAPKSSIPSSDLGK